MKLIDIKRKETPDNGQVNIKYNNDNSVRFSQDNYQFHRDEARPARYYTFHGYDGQNRMVYSGEIHDLNGAQGFDNLDPMQHYSFENYNEHPDNFLLVNVYDTIANARWQQYIYDYFGARYNDSRISVWFSPDPLFEKHLQWSPYNYVLRNPFVLIDPDGRQVHFSDEEKSRNLELNRYKHLLPEKYRQNIDITVNEKNEYILDHDLLLKANIDENEGVYINYKILLYLSSSSQMTNARFVNKEDLFVANIVNPRATINTSLSIMEKDLNIIYHGYTFVSNTVDNDQKPLFFSSCEDVNEIYIPLEDSELEQTKSLGHELDHVYRYLKNLNWKNEESDEFLNRELKNIESIIEKNY